MPTFRGLLCKKVQNNSCSAELRHSYSSPRYDLQTQDVCLCLCTQLPVGLLWMKSTPAGNFPFNCGIHTLHTFLLWMIYKAGKQNVWAGVSSSLSEMCLHVVVTEILVIRISLKSAFFSLQIQMMKESLQRGRTPENGFDMEGKESQQRAALSGAHMTNSQQPFDLQINSIPSLTARIVFCRWLWMYVHSSDSNHAWIH